MKKSNWYWIGALLLLGGLIAYSSLFVGKKAESGEVAKVAARVGPLRVAISAYGEIEPLKSTSVLPQIRSTATVSFLLDNGSRVKEGTVIARFVTDEIESKIEQLEEQISDEELTFTDRESQLMIQKLENTTNLKIAEDDLKSAELDLKKFKEASREMDRRKSSIDLQTAESDLTRAEKRYKDLEGLLKEGFITEDEVEEGRITLEQKRVAVETARMNQKILEDYDLPAQLTDLENKVSRATTKLEKTRSENKTLLLTKERQVETSRRALTTKKEQLAELIQDKENCEIKAPVDGVVYFGDADWRRREDPLQIGSILRTGQTLCRIPDLSRMRTSLNVPEADINRIALGQRVEIFVDAVPDEKYTGKISKIADAASDGGWFSSGVKEFEVDVELDSDKFLKPGYSCRAEIIVAELDKALLIPQAAVFRENGAFFVYLSKTDVPVPQHITLGEASVTHVQILEGLKEGDPVLLSRPVLEEPRKKK